MGFLGLPREIRNLVYWMLIEPSEKGKPGNTKVLCLCKQVYEEAIMYLKPYVPVFRLGIERHRSLFRNPKANGKPMIYRSTTLTSSCYTYQRFTELEICRFTSIQLFLDSIHGRYRHSVREKVVADVREITQAVRKSTHLQAIATYISEGWAANMTGQDELMEAYKQLVRVCGNKGIALVLQYGPSGNDCEEHDKNRDDQETDHQSSAGTAHISFIDSLVTYLQGAAAAANVTVTIHRPGEEPYKDLEDISDYNNYTILYRPQGRKSLSALQHHSLYSPCERELRHEFDTTYDTSRFYHPLTLDKPYKLIPECRRCLTIFGTREDLLRHLKKHPDHIIRFRRKRWNPISTFSINQGGRVCWTYGYSYNAQHRLNAHLERFDHRRYSIIPRYTEDNVAWDRK